MMQIPNPLRRKQKYPWGYILLSDLVFFIGNGYLLFKPIFRLKHALGIHKKIKFYKLHGISLREIFKISQIITKNNAKNPILTSKKYHQAI